MVEGSIEFGPARPGTSPWIDQAAEQIRDLVDTADLLRWKRSVERFGAEKPLALALASLTVGLAAGLLIRRVAQSREPR